MSLSFPLPIFFTVSPTLHPSVGCPPACHFTPFHLPGAFLCGGPPLTPHYLHPNFQPSLVPSLVPSRAGSPIQLCSMTLIKTLAHALMGLAPMWQRMWDLWDLSGFLGGCCCAGVLAWLPTPTLTQEIFVRAKRHKAAQAPDLLGEVCL